MNLRSGKIALTKAKKTKQNKKPEGSCMTGDTKGCRRQKKKKKKKENLNPVGIVHRKLM